ncbi:MAG: helix-turn-helix domain-containing protein [Acidobacteriaceae bacterium]|nr:helix-turn-helix domain-containing protein [Acidobacteriaceae bacterium]
MSANHSTSKKSLTVRESAEVLGISESLTRNLVNSGELVAYRYGQRKTVIYSDDLKAFRERHRVKSTSTAESA